MDDGKTFAPEKLAISIPTGACGCCGLKAFTDSQGNVLAFYRGASDMVNRDEIFLADLWSRWQADFRSRAHRRSSDVEFGNWLIGSSDLLGRRLLRRLHQFGKACAKLLTCAVDAGSDCFSGAFEDRGDFRLR